MVSDSRGAGSGAGAATYYLYDRGELTLGFHFLAYEISPLHGFCVVGNVYLVHSKYSTSSGY